MEWLKRGLIFSVEDAPADSWMHSHAQIPSVLVKDDRLRIYFSSRPEPGISLTTFLDVDRDNPQKVLYLHDKPILQLGPPGTFDEHGIMPSCVFSQGERVWLYYGGWSRRSVIPYSNWTGLAWSDDGGETFVRAFLGPVVDRTPQEIFSATAAFVMPGEESWHMWYASGTAWVDVGGKWEEVYRIRHGTSGDGIHWRRGNRELLPVQGEYEPTHRPAVIKIGDRYHMWFCRRGVTDFRDGSNAYRLGYAWSDDLIDWHRDDSQAGMTVSESGWDATMTAYPYVVQVGAKIYLFYNGNGFGQSGFGYAELNQPNSPAR